VNSEQLTQQQLAKALGVAPSQVTRYKKLGAPVSEGVEAMRRWQEANLAFRATKSGPKKRDDELDFLDDEDVDVIPFGLPEGTSPKDVLSRLQLQERTLHGQIQTLESRHLTSKLASRLTLLRREYRDTSKLCVLYERALVDLACKRGELVANEVADDYVMKILGPVIAAIKSLPRLGADQPERTLLARAGRSLLKDISETSALAARIAA